MDSKNFNSYFKEPTWILLKKGNPCYPVASRHSATGSYEKCATLIESLLDKTVNCSCTTCSFNGIFQPEIQNEFFYAIENFFYTARFFGLDEVQDFVSELIKSGTHFCQTLWSDILSKYPSRTVTDLEKYCFSSAYIPKVLGHGFGFKNIQYQNVVVVQKIAEKSIDWALGAVLLSLLNNGVVDVELSKPIRTASVHSPTDEGTLTQWNLFHPLGLIIIGLGIMIVVSIVLSSSKTTKRKDSNPV